MKIDQQTDDEVKKILSNTIQQCGGTVTAIEADIAATMLENLISAAAIQRAIAIAGTTWVPIPDVNKPGEMTQRRLDADEIVSALEREIGWQA